MSEKCLLKISKTTTKQWPKSRENHRMWQYSLQFISIISNHIDSCLNCNTSVFRIEFFNINCSSLIASRLND